MKLIVNRLTASTLPSRLQLRYWLTRVSQELGAPAGVDNEIIEVNFVDDVAMRKLNKAERGIDRSTDVLSFSFIGQDRFPGDNLAGQIFIEPDTAKKQASAHGVSQREEIQYLFVHGLLHVFGFDHETGADFRRMFGLQARIMPGPKWERFADQIHRQAFGGREHEAGSRGQQ